MKDPAELYYDSPFALNFYDQMWGKDSDIHIGLHDVDQDFARACSRTLDWLVQPVRPVLHSTLLDLGSGFGGPLRRCEEKGFRGTGLNISSAQNRIAVERGRSIGINPVIVKGSFEDLPFSEGQFDIVMSMDSFVHSERKFRILEEAFRVLRPNGVLVFTDLMVAEEAAAEEVQPLLERIKLSSMGTSSGYLSMAARAGFGPQVFEDRSACAAIHYRKLYEALGEKLNSPSGLTDDELTMMKGCDLWATAGENGTLVWGKFTMVKPA